MLCAEDNIQVCYPTTPAQCFHLLRRQVARPWRKPLIVMTPKSLLRHPLAVSSLDDLQSGTFQRFLPDPKVKPEGLRRLVLCSGKIYYDLIQEREKRGIDDIAVCRIEQFYPMSDDALRQSLDPWGKDLDILWVQEEPRNMGAWTFIKARWSSPIDEYGTLRCASRPESASPATGSKGAHDHEHRLLLDEALAD